VPSRDPVTAGPDLTASTGILVGVEEALQIGVCVLISVVVVMSLLVVWWDDHKWLDRQRL
jgi:hypothetical protein